jgi:glycosyltransferase involved in cell wall biosynthesis
VTSVVIAAHNEAAVIGRCLDALLAETSHPASPLPVPETAGQLTGLDITVVANGCTDATVSVAARRGVRVVELGKPGKAGALNAGDAVAVGFPRIYLDADIVLARSGLMDLVRALDEPAADGTVPLAVVPRRQLDLAGRPVAIRAFYAINSRLPVYRHGLFGRGVIALSAGGRARFQTFPDMIADDLFLDSLFADVEKCQVDTVVARIATPRRTRDLVRRLARVRAGNAAMRTASAGVRPAARSSWLRDVVLPRPWLAPAAACYVALTAAAVMTARRGAGHDTLWGRDDSSRAESAKKIVGEV